MNVLFIGNSFTARNNLPGLVAIIAATAGKKFEHRLISAGGASLRRHWNSGEALRAIKTGEYDFVVLQEQSTLPIKNPQRMHETVRLFNDAIKAAAAKTALYMTWARRHAPETQRQITAAYESIAAELRAQLIPAGRAWEAFLRKHDTPVLYDADGSHPTLAGSYLAACVAFLMLLRVEIPRGVEVPGLPAADEQRLRTVASRFVDSVR